MRCVRVGAGTLNQVPHGPSLHRTAWEALEGPRGEARGIAVGVGLPVDPRGALYDGAALLVDGAILDPKIWCRLPILSAGFERELAELRERVLRDLEGAP